MNCKNIQLLLPLYVGGDIEENQSDRVAGHLRSCGSCSLSADEYREAIEMMQQFTPPLFSEAVYSGIRRRVLLEIEHNSVPVKTSLFERFLRPRYASAIAALLLLVVGISAIYFNATRSDDASHIATGPAANKIAPAEQPNPALINVPKSTRDDVAPEDPVRDHLATISQKVKFSNPAKMRVFRSQLSRSPVADADRTEIAAVKTHALANVDASPSPQTTAALASIEKPEKTLRMEIQTKDPNIRIIWFASLQAKQTREK